MTAKRKAKPNHGRTHGRNAGDQRLGLPAVLFDLDGTLIDSVYYHIAAWADALKSETIVISSWKIHRHVGMSGKAFLHKMLREVDPAVLRIPVQHFEKMHDKNFEKRIGQIDLLPGAQPLLDHLTKQKVRWAIATTGNRKHTKLLLKKFDLPGSAAVVTGDDVERAKPSPDVFVLAAEKLGVAVSDCVVVGDSTWDLLAAGRKNGLGVGLLSGGYSQQELEGAGAFRVYADPAEMLHNIEDLGIPGP